MSSYQQPQSYGYTPANNPGTGQTSYVVNSSTHYADSGRDEKKRSGFLCCAVTKGVGGILGCCCLLIIVAIIIIVIFATSFTLPTFDMKGFGAGDPQFAVSIPQLGQVLSIPGSPGTPDQQTPAIPTRFPENTDMTINLIANLSIDNNNWFSLPIKDQFVDVFVFFLGMICTSNTTIIELMEGEQSSNRIH